MPWYDFSPWKIFFFPWKIFSFHGGYSEPEAVPAKSVWREKRAKATRGTAYRALTLQTLLSHSMGRIRANKTILLTPTKRVIIGSPSGGRTGAWGRAVSWGWSYCTSPKKQTARKRGGRGDSACWLGAFLGWSYRTSTRKHPASMRSKQETQGSSPKKSNIMPARNAKDEPQKV